jgi:plasmid replication initiation protein
MHIKLAEALLRRKELQEKLNVVRQFSNKDFFEKKVSRRQINETIDDIEMAVPKLTL